MRRANAGTRSRLLAVLLFAGVAACENKALQEFFASYTPHERYERRLQETGLAETAMGRDWIAAASEALEQAVPVTAPYREQSFLDERDAAASAYRVSLRRGQRLEVTFESEPDSTYQVLRLLELGAHPTIVTATTCHLTDIGRKNIDSLSRYATTIEVSPNKSIRAKLNRLGLEWTGDISWPEHAAIFSTPFRLAAETGINLIMYGENPQHQYGGPKGTEDAQLMTERWTQEFGGFLGLRPSDFEGVFEKLDKNGDGKVAHDELMPAGFGGMGTGGHGR